MYEVMSPLLLRICLPCRVTILNMIDRIYESYVLATNITNLFSKYDLQQSSALQPFEDRFFMCTPPSSGCRFQHKVQGRQSLRFCNFFFKSTRKYARLSNPSYGGSSLASAPTLQTHLVILAHLLMETSCNLFFQFSRASLESDVHEFTLLQLSFPSSVGFI